MENKVKGAHLTNPCSLAICAFSLVLLTHRVDGHSLAQYRNFELGVNVAAVSVLTGIPVSETKTIHLPAVLQNLEWRPSHWTVGSTVASTDRVEQIGFSFCNDRLFRVVVDYEHNRTEKG